MRIISLVESSRLTRANTLTCKIIKVLSKNTVMTSDGVKRVTDVMFEDDSGEIHGTIWHNNSGCIQIKLYDEITIFGGFIKKDEYDKKIKLIINNYKVIKRTRG